jgi:hypothetical protein
MRFGFIADELETVVPNVVRTTRGKAFSDQKAVQYQDLIALLAAAAQSQQQRIEDQQARIDRQDSKITSMMQQMEGLQKLAQAMQEAKLAKLNTAHGPKRAQQALQEARSVYEALSKDSRIPGSTGVQLRGRGASPLSQHEEPPRQTPPAIGHPQWWR